MASSWPRAGTLAAVMAAGVVAGAAGVVINDELAEQPRTELLAGVVTMPLVEDGMDLERISVGIPVHNNGSADFELADVIVPGWAPADPLVGTVIPAGEWVRLNFDVVADCDVNALGQQLELIGPDGEGFALAGSVQPLTSLQQRVCVALAQPGGPTPEIVDVRYRVDPDGGPLHVDIDVTHEPSPDLNLAIGAVTGRASGYNVELPDRLAELTDSLATITTDWWVRDCGGAAGTSGDGTPDLTSSGNFEGLTLHFYWSDGTQDTPIRIDRVVELPPEVITALARFAVTTCRPESSPSPPPPPPG